MKSSIFDNFRIEIIWTENLILSITGNMRIQDVKEMEIYRKRYVDWFNITYMEYVFLYNMSIIKIDFYFGE